MSNEPNETDLMVGKNIRRRRKLLGLTQAELAGMIGIRFQQIQKYECAANRVFVSRLAELAKALDVPVGYFFNEVANGDKVEGELSDSALAVAAAYDNKSTKQQAAFRALIVD